MKKIEFVLMVAFIVSVIAAGIGLVINGLTSPEYDELPNWFCILQVVLGFTCIIVMPPIWYNTVVECIRESKENE
jgi:hypothetical protein